MAGCGDFREFIKLKKKEVESTGICNISNELISEGNRLYSNWSQNKRWSNSDYNHRGFCVVYFQKFFYHRAWLVHQIFTHCELDRQLPRGIFEKNLKVVSFGCGPGNDLVGFKSFYHDVKTEIDRRCFKTLTKHMYRPVYKKRKLPKGKCKKQRNFQSLYGQSQECPKRRNRLWAKRLRNYTSSHARNCGHVSLSRKKLQNKKFKKYRNIQTCYAQSLCKCRSAFRKLNARVSYVGYDRSSEWHRYIDVLGYPFQQKDISTWSVEGIEPADIAILSYFSDSGYLYGSNYGFWRSLTKKFKLVLVIDTSYDEENVDTMLSRHGFRKTTNTFYNQNGKKVYTALWSKLHM